MVDIDILKEQLKETFKIEDLRLCNYFLRMKVTRDRENSRLNLYQDTYINKITNTFQLQDSDLTNYTTPIVLSALVDLIKNIEKATEEDITRY